MGRYQVRKRHPRVAQAFAEPIVGDPERNRQVERGGDVSRVLNGAPRVLAQRQHLQDSFGDSIQLAEQPTRRQTAGNHAPIQRQIKVDKKPIDAAAILEKASKDTGGPQHPELGRWLSKTWATAGEHDFDTWHELWEAAFTAYLAEKGVHVGESAAGVKENFASNFKKFERLPGNKLVASSKDANYSWMLLREMDAYRTIRSALGDAVRLPNPEVVRLPGEGDAQGPLALRMDFFEGGAFIDLFKAPVERILIKIAKTVLRDGNSAGDIDGEKAALKKLFGDIERLFKAAQGSKTAISDLQGHVAADGTFTLVDPLWAGSADDLTASDHVQFANMGKTMSVLVPTLEKAIADPRGVLGKYKDKTLGPSGD